VVDGEKEGSVAQARVCTPVGVEDVVGLLVSVVVVLVELISVMLR
jgi:hypothetical protein